MTGNGAALSSRRVLAIAGPIVLSNATIPLLGAVDTGVIGRMGAAAPIGAVGVGAFAVAAVLTPPDAVSQFMLAVPLWLLYESAIIAIRVTHWRAARRSAASPSDVEGPQTSLGPEAPPGGRG